VYLVLVVADCPSYHVSFPFSCSQMAEYFAEHGISNTLSAFKDQLGHLSYSAAYQKLNNWRNDMISQRELHQPGRPPNYGEYIL
jgi:hypothetical protein